MTTQEFQKKIKRVLITLSDLCTHFQNRRYRTRFRKWVHRSVGNMRASRCCW